MNRELCWVVLEKKVVPSKVVGMISSWHTGMQASIFVNGTSCEPFVVSSGLRQGCVLAPFLFNMFWNQVLLEWKKRLGNTVGVTVAYRFSNKLHNPRIKSCDGTVLVSEGLFADNMEV